MRDSQRQKCYDWEREIEARLNIEWVDHEYQLDQLFQQRTESEAREIIYKMRWQANMKKSPIIEFKTRFKGSSFYQPWSHRIVLRTTRGWTVVHEMCHAIDSFHTKRNPHWPRGRSHGRKFVGLMIHFMHRNYKVPVDLMCRLANDRNLDFQRITSKDLRI